MTAGARRSRALTLRYAPRPVFDLASMLRGQLAVTEEEHLVAVSLLTGAAHPLTNDELRLLSALPSTRWVALGPVLADLGLPPDAAAPLLDAGVVLADPAEGRLAELRAREERFAAMDWDDFAAAYHVMSRVEDQDVGTGVPHATQPPTDAAASSPTRVQGYVELAMAISARLAATESRYGPPPPCFHRAPGALGLTPLPLVPVEGRLFELLTGRKTIRLFDRDHPLTVEELSTLLRYTYGAHGWAELVPGLIGLRKTSPSGGSLHPIEVYPLVIQVQGLETGLYHYSVEHHGLELLRPLTGAEAEAMAETMTLGQSYFRSAHALFVLTARWYRNFWKYRRAQKSYRVIHLDAGHLSQTLYLLCEELGLGAFFTGAVNDVNIEGILGLDPLQEGVIGVSGCGRPLDGGAPLTLQTAPYAPRR
jgi:SagB-type dehydrogenase family enzyme